MLNKQVNDPDVAGVGQFVEQNFYNLGLGDLRPARRMQRDFHHWRAAKSQWRGLRVTDTGLRDRATDRRWCGHAGGDRHVGVRRRRRGVARRALPLPSNPTSNACPPSSLRRGIRFGEHEEELDDME